MAWMRYEVYTGGEGENEPSVSRCEQLMKAHRDIAVSVGSMTGEVGITQRRSEMWRLIGIDIEKDTSATKHYPTVVINGIHMPTYLVGYNDLGRDQRHYGLVTTARIHTENDEQVTVDIGYKERTRYPSNLSLENLRLIKRYAQPIPAQELIAIARIGLDMLKAYREATPAQQERIDATVNDFDRYEQVYVQPKPKISERFVAAIPLIAAIWKDVQLGIDHAELKPIYAYTALSKVTNAMLPSEMPPVPPNRREPRRRATPGVSLVRRTAGR